MMRPDRDVQHDDRETDLRNDPGPPGTDAMHDAAEQLKATDQPEPFTDIDALVAWIDDGDAPCPEIIEKAMAHDPALRSLVRDLRLGRLTPESASATLRNTMLDLGMPRPILAVIGRWSAAVAAAIAIALLGFQLGTSAAGPRTLLQDNGLAAFGLDDTTSDEAWVALLLPEDAS